MRKKSSPDHQGRESSERSKVSKLQKAQTGTEQEVNLSKDPTKMMMLEPTKTRS
tara:strand:+ start:533 stop:694 length:162 start_codon:yes stop_codon:yes gene_type:complete